MTVLSDADIEQAMQNNQLGIDPFIHKHLTPNGYDLSIDEIFIRKTDQHIKDGVAVVPPLTWFAVSTKECVTMGPQITSQLWIRSSYARKGILASFGKVDAGFSGTLTFGCFNASDTAVEIPIGDRFCQIVFENLEHVPKALYHERSGTYQHQRGVTLQR
ncbi:MAG: dCTP deaminase [Candidatus Thermoplasmatota archaeon]|nr:dCTP deaminase [Candidatus Thermoplasmatota archaeon]